MQLRQLPFTEVKIDRAFVADIEKSRDCRLIVRSIAELAHGLGLTATAEGVETLEQLELVKELGCDLVQGYFISPPLLGSELGAWRERFRRRWPALRDGSGRDLEADALGERQV